MKRAMHLDEIEGCFDAGKPMADAAWIAINDFRQKKIIEGLSEIGVVLQQLPDAFSTCTSVQDDIAAIEAWSDIFKHPIQLAKTSTKNLLMNGPAVAADIEKQHADWQSGDYFSCGEDVADALVLIVGPV